MSRPHASSVDAQDPWAAGDIASPLSRTRTADAQDDDDELDPAEIQEKERLVKYVFEPIAPAEKSAGLNTSRRSTGTLRPSRMGSKVGLTDHSGKRRPHPDACTPSHLHLPRTFSALLERISSVNKETQEIKSGNETLQTYIDNLTRNNAQAAVSGGGKR